MSVNSKVSQKDFWLLYGIKLAQEYYAQEGYEVMQHYIKEDGGITQTWQQLDPVMLYHHLPIKDVPKEHFDDVVNGIELVMNHNLINAYMEMRGAK